MINNKLLQQIRSMADDEDWMTRENAASVIKKHVDIRK